MKYLNTLKLGWKGISIAVAAGVTGVVLQRLTGWPVLDPLLVAMVIGIIIRSLIKFDDSFVSGFNLAPSLFIPIGVIFYGAVNLNFTKFAAVDTNYIFMLFIVFIVYIISALVLSNLFGLNEKTGYLIAAGSSICGASAIAITSKAVDAEPDDVSTSLIPVFISALVGLFFVLPLLSEYLNISGRDYGILSGVVLQFTGFVKAAVGNLSSDVSAAALSIKAVRYVGLIFIIPLFASFVKGRFFIPWYLWAFLGAGLAFTFMPQLSKTAGPVFKSILTVLWSIAMGAIGLNANFKALFTKKGLKAFGISFLSFLIAAGVFLVGIKLM